MLYPKEFQKIKSQYMVSPFRAEAIPIITVLRAQTAPGFVDAQSRRLIYSRFA